MISIQFGKIKRIKTPRLDIELCGDFETVTLAGCLVVTVGGQTDKMRSWAPGSVGDVVAVLFDDERPENSLVLGGVYGDADAVPKFTGGLSADLHSFVVNVKHGGELDSGDSLTINCDGTATVTAESVVLGSSTSGTSPAARYDRVNRELVLLRSELVAIQTAFNTHCHGLNLAEVPTTTLFPCALTNPAAAITYTVGYSVSSVACDSVIIK